MKRKKRGRDIGKEGSRADDVNGEGELRSKMMKMLVSSPVSTEVCTSLNGRMR